MVEHIINWKLESIRNLVTVKPEFAKEVLGDSRIKNKFIFNENKYELIWLVQSAPDDGLLVFFDEEGISLLKASDNLIDKMNAILTCGKEYVNTLLTKDSFCAIIVDNYRALDVFLSSLMTTGSINFAKYIKDNKPELLNNTILSFSSSAQKEVIKELDLPVSIKREILPSLSKKAIEYILDEDVGTIHLVDYRFIVLYHMICSGCEIPQSHLMEKEFLDKITTISSVKDYRFFINALGKNNDVDLLEQKRREYYETEIKSYNPTTKMLKRYYDFYLELCQMMEEEKFCDELITKKFFNFYGTSIDEWNILTKVNELLSNKDKQGLEQFLINESNFQLSNMIIDYHFKEVPYNFFVDVKQLLHFQEGKDRTISDEYLKMYQQLINVDNLGYDEKLSLHQRLSQDNFEEIHYDVFRETKDKIASLIKQKMLTFDSVKKFQNSELSDKLGVPIYILDGDEFYAFVKATAINKNQLLDPRYMVSTVDGGSYSLDGSKKLKTYIDPRTVYNLIFGDFPESQIVHMYTVDSYSKYSRTYGGSATPRVYELYGPEEFVEKSLDYNEIVLAQKNVRRRDDELNESLDLPKLMGIYCYDEISENDVLSARELGIGIVLVKTNCYTVKTENKRKMADTLVLGYGERYTAEVDYLNDISADDMINRRNK